MLMMGILVLLRELALLAPKWLLRCYVAKINYYQILIKIMCKLNY